MKRDEICDIIEEYQVVVKEYKPIECGESLVQLADAILAWHEKEIIKHDEGLRKAIKTFKTVLGE